MGTKDQEPWRVSETALAGPLEGGCHGPEAEEQATRGVDQDVTEARADGPPRILPFRQA